MKRLKKILIPLSLILLLAMGCLKERAKDRDNEIPIKPIEDTEEVDKIQHKIDSMSVEEKLGQLLIVGFEGTNLDEHTRSLIKDLKVSGVILFKRNVMDIEQVVNLTNKLKQVNKDNIPLFISIDEEGGRVSRLPEKYKRLPEAKKVGDLDDRDISFKYGELLGLRLKSLGFNLDYAPVMDINSNPDNPVIGSRSFGTNPEIVFNNGIQVARGIKSQDIISGIKHFPGHGDTGMDSHVNLPVINKSMEEMREFELIPFERSIEEGIDMVMIAHILFPEIDDKYPSTMSREIIDDLLRDELGFQGVVVSDDMTMGAITENYSLEEATLKFLQSGGDIALVCHGIDNPKKVIDYLKKAVVEGELSLEDIDEKLYRILSLKEKYKLKDNLTVVSNLEEINIKTRELLDEMKYMAQIRK